MSIEILSPIIIITAAIAFMVLERMFPYTKNQNTLRSGFWNDLGMYTIVQSYVMSWVIYGIIHIIDANTHLTNLRLLANVPIVYQAGFFLVEHDLYIYWFHRWQHHSKYLWRIHEAHHSTPEVDWLSGARSHSLEILINQTIEFAPIVLLGAAPQIAVFKGIIDAVWGMYIHSNIDARSGKLQYIINGPEMHRWHHAKEISTGINFSTKLAIWDWLFGTAYLPRPNKPADYGVADLDFPSNYFSQHAFAFRPFEEE